MGYELSAPIVLFFCVLITTPFTLADRGIIAAYPDISVYEPGQKAILAWNGERK